MIGELVAMHRKVHLFDIDIPGKITFKVGFLVYDSSCCRLNVIRRAKRSPGGRQQTRLTQVRNS